MGEFEEENNENVEDIDLESFGTKKKMHYLKRRNPRRRRTWILIWTALVPRKRRRKRRRLILTIWIMKRIKKMKQMTPMLTHGRILIVITNTTSCFKESSVL